MSLAWPGLEWHGLETELEEADGHMTVHVIKSYVWESHMKTLFSE